MARIRDYRTGKGQDRLGKADDRLLLQWRWFLNTKRANPDPDEPHQRCLARMEVYDGHAWLLDVTGWVDGYDAHVGFMDEDGVSVNPNENYPTRVAAQQAAEKYLRDVCRGSVRALKAAKQTARESELVENG